MTSDQRIKHLEEEVAYLTKAIVELSNIIQELEPGIQYYLTNIYYSKDYLEQFNNGE